MPLHARKAEAVHIGEADHMGRRAPLGMDPLPVGSELHAGQAELKGGLALAGRDMPRDPHEIAPLVGQPRSQSPGLHARDRTGEQPCCAGGVADLPAHGVDRDRRRIQREHLAVAIHDVPARRIACPFGGAHLGKNGPLGCRPRIPLGQGEHGGGQLNHENGEPGDEQDEADAHPAPVPLGDVAPEGVAAQAPRSCGRRGEVAADEPGERRRAPLVLATALPGRFRPPPCNRLPHGSALLQEVFQEARPQPSPSSSQEAPPQAPAPPPRRPAPRRRRTAPTTRWSPLAPARPRGGARRARRCARAGQDAPALCAAPLSLQESAISRPPARTFFLPARAPLC